MLLITACGLSHVGSGRQKALAAAAGTRGMVRKPHTIFFVGQTRVHLDRVEGLGECVEPEVVLRPRQNVGEGLTLAPPLMARLGISPDQLIDRACVDLLA